MKHPRRASFSNDAPKVAVVDRDGSELSAPLTDFALKDAVEVHVEDSTFALQDAAAKDLASYVLIIRGVSKEGLVEAAHSGADAPTLENRGELPGRAWRAHGPAREGVRAVAFMVSLRLMLRQASVMLRTMQRPRAVTRRLWSFFFRSIQKAFR